MQSGRRTRNIHAPTSNRCPERWGFPRYQLVVVLAVSLLLCNACSSTRSERGVETRWHDVQSGAFEEGQTTRKEVLKALGPPSQIVTMEHETALYYMLERTKGTGITLIVYNFRREHSSYDRAVFFFNLDGVLTDFAYTDAPD